MNDNIIILLLSNFYRFIDLSIKRFLHVFTGYSWTFERVVLISNVFILVVFLFHGEVLVNLSIVLFLSIVFFSMPRTILKPC